MSARGDLNPANGTYEFSGMGHRNHGGLDYKVVLKLVEETQSISRFFKILTFNADSEKLNNFFFFAF